MSQLTKANLATQVSTLLADNTAGDISASDVRSVFTDTAESLIGGPTSATDNALVRFDATTGMLAQNSVGILSDAGILTGLTGITSSGTAALATATVSATLGVTGIATFADDIIGGASSDIAINTNKFTVAASSGNTLIAGTLAVTGATTQTGNLTVAGYIARSVGNALTAAGTTRADALQLAKEVNNVTTAAASTGVILPVGVIGMRIAIFNAGANPIKVYASASETIDTIAGATGVTLTNAKRADFFMVAANTWISAQLGVISA